MRRPNGVVFCYRPFAIRSDRRRKSYEKNADCAIHSSNDGRLSRLHPYDPGQRAVSGGLIGAGAGALIGGAAAGDTGAAIGAATGGALGAITGAAMTPPPPPPRVAYRGCGPGAHWVRAHYNPAGHWVRAHCAPNY